MVLVLPVAVKMPAPLTNVVKSTVPARAPIETAEVKTAAHNKCFFIIGSAPSSARAENSQSGSDLLGVYTKSPRAQSNFPVVCSRQVLGPMKLPDGADAFRRLWQTGRASCRERGETSG